MLSLQNVSYAVAKRTLLDGVSVNIPSGHRIGLVGPNGAGKTTLFRLISGDIALDDGSINLMRHAKVGIVRQDIPEDGRTLVQIVLDADSERKDLLIEAETSEDPDRLGTIYDRLLAIDAYEAPSRAASILAGLGFDEEAQARPISSFSGGWRARVALAAALFCQPDVLLLDEPTNHLDFESIIWLENFLIRYPHTFVMISHDREILNKTVNHILHLENKKLVSYTGNYDQFERTRAERLMNQQALHEKQTAQKAHLMKFVDRFRASASKARQAQSRLKAIERMDIVDAVMAERVKAFTFPSPKDIKSPLIRLDKVDAGYVEGMPVLRKLDLTVNQGDRIALLGANGNGKSTLIKVLCDRLAPMGGEVHKSGKLGIGYFAQFQTDELDVTQTPFQVMQAAMREPSEVKVRSVLYQFGFDKNKADTLVGGLSGGEKARLLFCLMSYEGPHILLLDEPTNHLDMDARAALIQALNDYSGAVILVSHDPHLVSCVADQLWLVADGKCKPFDDDLEGYRKFVLQQRRLDRSKERSKAEGAQSSGEKKSAQSEKQDHVKIDAQKIERDAFALEQKIGSLYEEKTALEAEIAVAFTREEDHARMRRLNKNLADLQQSVADAELALNALISQL